MKLKGEKVLVVGLRRTGVASAKFLAMRGAQVTVTDKDKPESFKEEKRALRGLKVKYSLGEHKLKDFLQAKLIVVSPGVPLTIPELESARKAGIRIIGELELAYRFVKVPIIAITGTNGKSTVTSLIGEILKNEGKKVFVGGNIGNPLLNLALSKERVDFAVVEVSSFQLETIEVFKPSIALMLNITPDHLDRYPNMESYVQAKARIFMNQSESNWAVVNFDDNLAMKSFEGAKSRLLGFSLNRKPATSSRTWVKGDVVFVELENNGSRCRLSIPLNDMKLAGLHNVENVCAAVSACVLAGASADSILKTINTFQGLAHRVQFVREVNGVRYFDDSKGTNVGAVEKSLTGFNSPVVLIAGGLDKGSDFTLLRPLLKKHARALILIGDAKEKMFKQLGDVVPTHFATDMKDAVRKASECAKRGDVVLLSPACASFDMFKNYAHRGEVFQEAVKEL